MSITTRIETKKEKNINAAGCIISIKCPLQQGLKQKMVPIKIPTRDIISIKCPLQQGLKHFSPAEQKFIYNYYFY